MFKNKSDASVKKLIILAAVLAIGCGGIAYLGYHQGAHKAPPLVLKTLGEATKGDLSSLKFDNLDLTNVRKIPSLSSLYKGTFYLPDTEAIVKAKAESFFKKQAKEIKIKYDRNFFKPYNTQYSPAGCDYEVNDDITMSYSRTAFFTCIRNYDMGNLNHNPPESESFDLNAKVGTKEKEDVDKLTEKVDALLRNTGMTFDITLSPHKYTVSKLQDGKTIKTLYFQMKYKEVPFVDVMCGEKYLPWITCLISSVNDAKDGEMITLEGMSLKAKKLSRIRRVISASEALRLFSRKLSGHKKYDVSSVEMEYMSRLIDEKRKQCDKGILTSSIEEGNEYVMSPYWAIYLDATPDREIMGYVNAQNGEVLFVNNQEQVEEDSEE